MSCEDSATDMTAVNLQVREFCEHTTDVWSQWSGLFAPLTRCDRWQATLQRDLAISSQVWQPLLRSAPGEHRRSILLYQSPLTPVASLAYCIVRFVAVVTKFVTIFRRPCGRFVRGHSARR